MSLAVDWCLFPRLLTTLAFALLLSACNDNDSAGEATNTAAALPASSTPALTLAIASPAAQTLAFSWNSLPGASHYKLLVSSDGADDYAQSGSDITGTSTELTLEGQPLDWVNARYKVEAYDDNNTLLATSPDTSITSQLLAHADSHDTSDAQGWSATLSSDGKTLAVGVPDTSGNTESGKSGVYLLQRDPVSGEWASKNYVKSARMGNRWGPHVDLEAKLGNKRTLGEVDLFVPLTQDSHNLLFTDLRGRFDDNSSHEFNLGLGLRRMTQRGWNLGLYGYLDRRTSENSHDYNQATLGVEVLGTNWDFRSNAYAPFGSRTHDLTPTSTASLAGASIQVVTDSREERALSGFDAELGWRTPLYDSEAARQLRLYAGGYHFSGGGLTVQGPRLRAELEMEDLSWFGGTRLTVGAEVQRDDTRGTQSFVSARLRIPLGGSKERTTLSAQERRMTAPIVRDVDILTVEHVTARQVETATTTSGGQAITVLDSATTSGAALPGAVAAAGSNSLVVLSGTFNTTATTTLQSGQTVMGGGPLTVTTPSGYSAILWLSGGTVNATIGGTGSAATNPGVMMANNSTIDGLNISLTRSGGTGAFGVYVDNVSGATIRNSTIKGSETGANASEGVTLNNATSITISGNTISAVAAAGQSGLALLIAAGSSATVTGNTMSATGGATNYAVGFNNGTALSGSTGNVRSDGTCYAGGINTGTIYFTDSTTCP